MYKLRLLIGIILINFTLGVYGTSNLQFSHLSINDGLPYSHVTSIKQDAKRYMWIGTRKGLFRYDGYTISPVKSEGKVNSSFIRQIHVSKAEEVWVIYHNEVYRYAPNRELMVKMPIRTVDSESRINYSNQSVRSAKIVESSVGQLFLLTPNCLYVFDNQNNEFKPHEMMRNKILKDPIYDLAADHANGLWIIDSNSLYHINLKTITTTEYNIKNLFTLGRLSRVRDMIVDSENNLWIATFKEGVIRVNKKTGEYNAFNKETGYDISIARVLLEDNQKQLWIGGENGLRVIDLRTNRIVKSIKQNYQNVLGINDDATYALFQDKESNIWIGGYFGGINILYKDNERFSYYPPGYISSSISGKAVRQILEDGSYLWIATEDGGLNKFNKVTREFQHYKASPSGIASNNVHSLLKDREGNLWLGTFDAGINILNLRTNKITNINTVNTPLLKNDLVFSLLQDHEGIIYIGTVDGLTLYDPSTKNFFVIDHPALGNLSIYHMLLDSQDNIWIATRQGGLLVYNKRKNTIKSHTANMQDGSIKDNSITQIFEDSNKRIWIGTNTEGLFYYDSQTDGFVRKLSFGDNGVSGIVEDNNKTLWVSTEKGLTKIDLRTDRTYNYTKDDGLYSDNFNANSAIFTHEGELFFGTINGLISFNPNSINEKVFKPNVILTKLYIGGEEVSVYTENSPLKTSLDESEKITLSNQQASSFSIEYAAIYYGHSQSLKYATFMEGIDKNWNFLSDQRRVNFSHLPSGKYVFKVKAVSSNEDWENAPVRSIVIAIKPPFYLSVWAWIIYVIVVTGIVAFANRFLQVRRNEKNQIQLERIERNKIQEINRTKIDFFTNISHELKTPLTLIISPLQRLLDTDQQVIAPKETMKVILSNAKRMSRIVDELMTFSKIEIGKEKLTLNKGNVLEFISNISITFKLLALEKNIHFNAIIENNGEDVWFSISSIEKIVYNLLSNSFKFTSAGGNVTIEARLTEDDKNKIFLEIVVSDTGEGIQTQYLDKIFENYFQADPNLNIRGSGIGLSLTKRLVNLHKGSIEVESELGKGSTFMVKIDVSEDSYSADEKFSEILDNDFFKKYNYITIGNEIVERSNAYKQELNEEYIKSILLVDDNEEMLNFLCDIFKDKFRILKADNGRTALEIVYKENPDLVISDVMMPVMDGFEFCRHIKTDFNTCHIPVILLTAKTGSDDKMEGYETGADFYVEKPFDARLLEMQVQNIVKTHLKNIELLKSNPQKTEQRSLMSERDCAFVEKLNELIELNVGNHLFSISDITKSLNVSRTLLHVKCKKLIDTSVIDYIRERRMIKAKEMLLAGHNISETAYAVGFSDPGYFSKVFRKQFNILPSDFIKQ